MRLIDADAKIMAQFYDDEHEDWIVKEITVADYLSFSDTPIPFVDAVPVVHGEWEPSDKYKGFVSCSVCHDCYVALSWIQGGLKWHYCPNCGAKMDGGDHNAGD